MVDKRKKNTRIVDSQERVESHISGSGFWVDIFRKIVEQNSLNDKVVKGGLSQINKWVP